MPLDPKKSTLLSCCSKIICDGCIYALESNGGDRCPFCRELVPSREEYKKRMMKRVKVNDPAALSQTGTYCYEKGDNDKALKYWTKAAKLEDIDAHNQLGVMYWEGGVVEKDEEKAVYHYEKAAIGGHPIARYNLGCYEGRSGNIERAVKHFVIAANLGDEDSMKELWKHYSKGNINKNDLEATLRTHKAAIDAMKSPQRETAEAWRKRDSPLG
jgi:TPR repeat protein